MRNVGVTMAAAATLAVASPVAADTRALAYAVAVFGSGTGGAGGGEAIVNERIGIGAELGFFLPGLWVAPGASIRVPTRTGVVPFVSAGYMWLNPFLEPTQQGIYAGCGMDVPMNARHALRLDFRNSSGRDRYGPVRTWMFRAGVTFRD